MPVASSATTSVSTARTGTAPFGPGFRPASAASDPAAAASVPAAASDSAARAAVAADGADAAGAATCARRSSALLTDRPMHGYEMIQEIAERSSGLWRPSPGSVYPTLQLLVDEGLIVATESEGSKRLFELTDDGRAAAEKVETPPWDEIADGADPGAVNLRTARRPADGRGGAVRARRHRPSSSSASSTSSTTPAARSTASSAKTE